MNLDLACAAGLLAAPLAAGAGYAIRVQLRGGARSARVEKDAREGESALLARTVMEMFYWALAPVGAMLVRGGASANGVSLASLALGLAAGAAVADARLGLGALLAAIAAIADALDGMVAKASGTASEAGEVLDAAVDRYTELALFAGIAVLLRGRAELLVLTLAALGGAFMISYSTAKAEALGVTPPRGSMRRSDRAVVLVAGCAFVPIVGAANESLRLAPLVAALALVAVLGNVSAVRRLMVIAAAVGGSVDGRVARLPSEKAREDVRAP